MLEACFHIPDRGSIGISPLGDVIESLLAESSPNLLFPAFSGRVSGIKADNTVVKIVHANAKVSGSQRLFCIINVERGGPTSSETIRTAFVWNKIRDL